MIIFNWKQFNEAISGQELVMPIGPAYGRGNNDKMIGPSPAETIYSEITSKIYTHDDYQDVYQEYLKQGGTPLHGFTKENLDKILSELEVME